MSWAPATDIARVDAEALLREPDRTRKQALMQRLAQESRIDVLDLLHDRGTGHWGGASSIAELLTVLYFDQLAIDPQQPEHPDRDRLIISKGHASAMIYCLMAKRGFLPLAELASFRQLDSRLQGHPCMRKLPGIDLSTGALGHGISVATGIACSHRVCDRKAWTWCIVGEGCLNEGQSWEGLMSASKFRPERLVIAIDRNRVQLDGPSEEIMPLEPLADKLRAFGCNLAPDPIDGHDVGAICASMEWIRAQTTWPVAVIYETRKGRGVSFMEDQAAWHGATVDDGSFGEARPELLVTLEALA